MSPTVCPMNSSMVISPKIQSVNRRYEQPDPDPPIYIKDGQYDTHSVLKVYEK